MTNLKALFPRLPNGQARTVSDLEAKLTMTRAELAEAEREANEAFLDGKEVKQSRLDTLRGEVERLTGALDIARDRVMQNEQIAKAEDDEAAWRKTEKLARARADLAVDIEVSVLKLTDAFKELSRLNQELYGTAPVRLGGLHNTSLSMASAEHALRLYLFKNGFKWAADYPWNVADIPLFSERVKDSNKEILAKRKSPEVAA